MDPLSISASITALLQLTSTVVQYLNDVKGAPEDRGRILSELASVNSILFILQDQADQAKQDGQWSSTFQTLNVPEGPLDQFRRALERLSSKLAPSATPLKKLGKALVWPFRKEEIKEILVGIERQKALLSLARQNDHIKLSKAIKDDVALVRDEVEEVAKGVSRVQMSSDHLNIIAWLNGPDPSTNYNKAIKERNANTGSWFLQSNEYADWKATRGSLLWLHGIPGCGKTILCSTILQNMLDQQHSKPNSAVLFFYFDFNDAEKQRHEKMIRSLICQLSKCSEIPVLQGLYASCNNGNRQPTGETLLSTLRQILASLGDIYIILDALDECEERDELLIDLEKILLWEDVDLHVLATSRREQDIEEVLTPLTNTETRISIQSNLVNADIRTYVHDRLQVDRKLKRWQNNPKVRREIEDTLMKKADGMFRWVACQLDLLGDCFHLPHLRQALASLPKTLDDTYERILCNIDKNYNHYHRQTLKMLQWLTFSARPLKLKELAETFAIDVNEAPRFDPERRLPEPRDIMTICSSLITLTANVYNDSEFREDFHGSNTVSVAAIISPEGSRIYVRLAHFSVKEYLVSDRIQHGVAAHYSIREIESHGILAEDCIAYLLQSDEPGSLTSETLEQSPLAHYAAQHWADHARHAEKGPIESTTLLSVELLMSDDEGLSNWIRIADPDKSPPWETFRWENLIKASKNLASPLYYASQIGLFESVKMLIARNMDINVQGGRFGNALQAAVVSRDGDVIQILIENGANVNARGGHFGTALIAACSLWSEEEEMVKMLLDKGADINALGGPNGSALQAASSRGLENVVKMLLDRGADVYTWGEDSEDNALQLASRFGYKNVVKMLLDRGADVNALGKDSEGSALQLASKNGHEEVVKVLLDRGADVDIIRGNKGSALQLASENGHENVVKMLLDKGADVNDRLKRSFGGTALELASKYGYENVVKMLLDRGADIEAPSGWSNGSALQLASRSGHENVVKVLLDKGADVNARSERSKRSALQLASWYGHKKVVKMLLAKGAVIPEYERPESEQGHDPPVENVGESDAIEPLPTHGASSPAPK